MRWNTQSALWLLTGVGSCWQWMDGLVCMHIDTSLCTVFGSLISGCSWAGAGKGQMVRRSSEVFVARSILLYDMFVVKVFTTLSSPLQCSYLWFLKQCSCYAHEYSMVIIESLRVFNTDLTEINESHILCCLQSSIIIVNSCACSRSLLVCRFCLATAAVSKMVNL